MPTTLIAVAMDLNDQKAPDIKRPSSPYTNVKSLQTMLHMLHMKAPAPPPPKPQPQPQAPPLSHAQYDWRTDAKAADLAVFLLHNPPFQQGYYRCGTCALRIPKEQTASHLDAHFNTARLKREGTKLYRGWWPSIYGKRVYRPQSRVLDLNVPEGVNVCECTVCGDNLPAVQHDDFEQVWFYAGCMLSKRDGLVHQDCYMGDY